MGSIYEILEVFAGSSMLARGEDRVGNRMR